MARILIVDDSGTSRMMAQMALAGERYQLVTAKDGVEALEQARRHRPDLILLDVIMPRMDGFEVCQKLREEADTQNTPILMITTRGEEANVERGYEVGCTDYICKPFIPSELLEKIRLFLPRD
jgi:two-component system alkaline phosphatase synthesis response regulator PhoP